MITFLLTKLPWLLKVLNFFKHKTRLAIEYIMIAAIVVLVGVIFSTWSSKKCTDRSVLVTQKELQTVQQRLSTVESVNHQQEATISELKELRLQDAKAFIGLLNDFKVLADNDARARDRLATLDRSNEDVREYLNQRIPPDLVCLLNNTCDAGNPGNNKSGASDATRDIGAAVQPGNGSATGTDKRSH